MKTSRFALTLTCTLLLSASAQAVNPPTVTAPVADSTVSLNPTFTWSASPGAVWYRVWLTDSGNNGNNPSILHCDYNQGAVNPQGCWVQTLSFTVSATDTLTEGDYVLWVAAWSNSQEGPKYAVPRPFKAAPRFKDMGKTVLDNTTGLEWEKKTDDGGIHDKDNTYLWTSLANNPVTNAPDGAAFTNFLGGLNAGACVSKSADGVTESNETDCSFAGHADWRMPTVTELKTLVDCSFKAATGFCIDPVFGPSAPGNSTYWTSSSCANDPSCAWGVLFGNGLTPVLPKAANSASLRAVRRSR